MNIYETLLLFALVCALSAFFVMWAKWEEEKVKTREEREKRWDEISRALSIEKELEQSKAREKCSADALMFYAEHLIDVNAECDALQDRLSDILCPHNDHVWKDGVCVKCGRVKDATD